MSAPLTERMVAALRNRSSRLADMYSGACKVLGDPDNPDRVALAAHGMRELMEKAQRDLEVTVRPMGFGTGRSNAAFDHLQHLCTRARQESSTYVSRQGEIDTPTAAVLEAVEAFVGLRSEERPRRIAQQEDLMRRLDPLGYALPADVLGDWIARWDSWHNLFHRAAHHQEAVSVDDLKVAIDQFSAFFVERLEPAPSRARDEIEQLIREAEGR